MNKIKDQKGCGYCVSEKSCKALGGANGICSKFKHHQKNIKSGKSYENMQRMLDFYNEGYTVSVYSKYPRQIIRDFESSFNVQVALTETNDKDMYRLTVIK